MKGVIVLYKAINAMDHEHEFVYINDVETCLYCGVENNARLVSEQKNYSYRTVIKTDILDSFRVLCSFLDIPENILDQSATYFKRCDVDVYRVPNKKSIYFGCVFLTSLKEHHYIDKDLFANKLQLTNKQVLFGIKTAKIKNVELRFIEETVDFFVKMLVFRVHKQHRQIPNLERIIKKQNKRSNVVTQAACIVYLYSCPTVDLNTFCKKCNLSVSRMKQCLKTFKEIK